MKLALSALVLSVSLTMPLQAVDRPVDPRPSARAELQQLVERFKHAILVRDGKAMGGLFLPGASGFSGFDRTSLAALRAKDPEATQFGPLSSWGLVESLVDSTAALEEISDHVHIETDGTVGMVWFEYRFIVDGKQAYHGVETWQVIRESDGWKISAMLSSVILDH